MCVFMYCGPGAEGATFGLGGFAKCARCLERILRAPFPVCERWSRAGTHRLVGIKCGLLDTFDLPIQPEQSDKEKRIIVVILIAAYC